MRITVVTMLVAALFAVGCGKDNQPVERAADQTPRKSTTIVGHLEIDGEWAFIEGYEVLVQFLGRGGWSEPKTLKAGSTARHRQYYGSAVRLTVCESSCGDAGDIVDRPAAIRCQVRANQPRGKTSPLRVTPHLVRDGDGDIGCKWTGSGIVADHCAPSNEFDGPVDPRRLVSPAQLSSEGRFKFVERHGCMKSSGGVRFTTMGWEGSFDCNSAAGRWRMGPGRRVRFGTNTSTMVACGTPFDVAPEDIAYIERLPSGDVRLLDEHWFPLVVGAPERDVPSAYSAPEGARIAVVGTVVARGDDIRICSLVFSSQPPGCGDIGGKPDFIGSTLRVEGLDLDDYESKHASDVRWIDEAALVGSRRGDTLTVQQ